MINKMNITTRIMIIISITMTIMTIITNIMDHHNEHNKNLNDDKPSVSNSNEHVHNKSVPIPLLFYKSFIL